MKWKIVAFWVISCLAVSSAKAQFNTVRDNVCRYKVKKVEEKLLPPANNQVDSVTVNLPQQETDSVDNKQKQWISSYPSITYPLKSIKVTSPYGYRRDPIMLDTSATFGSHQVATEEPKFRKLVNIF